MTEANTNTPHTKFLIVARSLPYVQGGTMIVLRRLIENFTKGEAYILGRRPFQNVVLNDTELNAHMTEIKVPRIKGYHLWMLLAVIPGIFKGLKLLKKHNIPVIIGVYPDAGSLLLSYFLHKISGKPYMAYFCDLYYENHKKGWKGALAKWLQPRVFKSATIIAVNDAVKIFYKEKYNVDSVLIQTAINQELPTNFTVLAVEDKFIIGYSGSIIFDRLDPMQDLIKAIGNNPKYEIRLFTTQTEEFLKANNLYANNVKLKFCKSVDELIAELQQCHLLYLPLTFKLSKSTYEQLATCFGIKSYEYLLSCRPTFVHCPPEYFTSSFFADNNCGYCIGKVTPEELKQYIEEIINNYATTAPIYIKNGLIAAEQFKGDTLAGRLRNSVKELATA